jgi:6-phosphogluconolactonase
MGDDGHTASLFPHTAALTVQDRLVTLGQKGNDPRITFTVPLINQARCVIFLAAGAGKRSALAQVFAEVGDDLAYPSRLVRPAGQLYWLLDRAAGENLGKAP